MTQARVSDRLLTAIINMSYNVCLHARKDFMLVGKMGAGCKKENQLIAQAVRACLMLLVCLLPAFALKSQTLEYLSTKDPRKKLDIRAFSSQLKEIYSDSAVGWAFSIWKNGKLLHDESGGFKITPSDRIDNIGLPFLTTTKIHVASFSKTITAVAIAKLVDQKQLKWDDRARSFLPSYWEVHPAFEDLKISELVFMTSGIDGPLDALSSKTESLRRIMEKGPNPEKKGKFNYSNTSYGLLRIIIGYATGYKELQPAVDSLVVGVVTANLYRQYVNKELFKPAGISSAACEVTDLAPAFQYPFPYENETGELTGGSEHLENGNLGEYAGGFGWYLSALEAAKFINAAFVNKKLLSQDAANALFRTGYPFIVRKNSYGSYFGSGGDWGHPVEGKGWRGIHAYYYCFPEDIVVTVFVNSGEGAPTKRVIRAYEAAFVAKQRWF